LVDRGYDDKCFIVKDHNGQKLAYIYFEDERGGAQRPKLLTRDEARRTLRGVFFSHLSIMARACNSASLRNPMTTLPFISTPAE